MNHQKRKIKFFFLLFAAYLPDYGYSQEFNIDQIETNIRNGREYARDFPSTRVTIRDLKSNFLELENKDPIRINLLINGLEEANLLLKTGNLTNKQRIRAAEMAGTALRLLLQGWNYAGHLSLLDGLRVSYPNPNFTRSTSPNPDINPPSSCLPTTTEEDQDPIKIRDLCMAKGFFEQGLSLVLNTLANRNLHQDQPEILVLDGRPLNASYESYTGYFTKKSVPQYTHYIIDGKIVVPILTEGYQMGQILQKYLQTVQTIAQREWGEASFSNKMPDTLRHKAVQALYLSTHHAFLADLALAAQTPDQAKTTSQSPYRIARLDTVRGDIASSRETIRLIRAGKKPILSVDDITASDQQISDILVAIRGKKAVAELSYSRAKKAIEKQFSAEQLNQNDQNVVDQWVNDIESLTGFQFEVDRQGKKVVNDQSIDNIRTVVKKNIDSVIKTSRKIDRAGFTNTLDQRINSFLESVDYYNHQALIIRTLEDNINIEEMRYEKTRKIVEATSALTQSRIISIGYMSMVGPISISVGVGTTGISTSYDHKAVEKAKLQAENEKDRTNQQLGTLDVENQAVIAKLKNELLLQLDQLQILGRKVDSSTENLNNTIGDINKVLDQISLFQGQKDKLWYNDPSIFLAPTRAEEIANHDQEALIADLYRYGKMLQIRWKEDFKNPLKCNDAEPAYSLGTKYAQFIDLESIFNLGNVQPKPDGERYPYELATLFLEAMEAWQAKLGNCRNTSTNRLEPVTVSLRQDILGWRDIEMLGNSWKPAKKNSRIESSNIKKFQNWLKMNRVRTVSTRNEGHFSVTRVVNRLRLTFPLDHTSVRLIVDQGKLLDPPIIPRLTNNPWNIR